VQAGVDRPNARWRASSRSAHSRSSPKTGCPIPTSDADDELKRRPIAQKYASQIEGALHDKGDEMKLVRYGLKGADVSAESSSTTKLSHSARSTVPRPTSRRYWRRS